MAWNPETSSWELPPTSNLTTPPPELFPPESPPEGVCANTAKPGDLISITYPNDTQIVYTFVGEVEMSSEADIRVWSGFGMGDYWWRPETMDTPTLENTIYSPPTLSLPMPSGVTPDMVTDGMIMAGSSEYVAVGPACVIARTTTFKGTTEFGCYHANNHDAAEAEWAKITYPDDIGLYTHKERKILTIYNATITFPFPIVHDDDEPLTVPVMASLALVSFLMGAAAGAGVAPTPQRRKHVSFE